MHVLSFSRKCKSTFRLRRRDHIEVQAPILLLFASISAHPFWHRFFEVVGPLKGTTFESFCRRSAEEAGPLQMRLIEAHSESSLCAGLKGSFGEPAAGSTSPSASTRTRGFVCVCSSKLDSSGFVVRVSVFVFVNVFVGGCCVFVWLFADSCLSLFPCLVGCLWPCVLVCSPCGTLSCLTRTFAGVSMIFSHFGGPWGSIATLGASAGASISKFL